MEDLSGMFLLVAHASPERHELTLKPFGMERAVIKTARVTPESGAFAGVKLQIRVVYALLLRETLTRYGRHNIGFLWIFCEPMLFTFGVTVIWNLLPHTTHSNIPVTPFVLTGYSAILLWRNVPNRTIGAVGPNASLLHHSPVRLIDVYLARAALEVVGASISMMLLAAILIATGHMQMPNDTLLAVGGWVLLAWYSTSLGLIVGAASEESELVERIWHILQYVMIPLSGSFFVVDSLPEALKTVALTLPTVSCVEMFREGVFGPVIIWSYRTGYVIAFNLVSTMVGLLMVRRVARLTSCDG